MHGLVAAAESCSVCRCCARAYVQYQRYVFASCRDQEILCGSDIRAGQECGCTPAGQCQAGGGGDYSPRPLGRLCRQCLAEKIRAAVFEFAQPDRIGFCTRRRPTQYSVGRNAGLRQHDRAVAVEYAIQSFLADV